MRGFLKNLQRIVWINSKVIRFLYKNIHVKKVLWEGITRQEITGMAIAAAMAVMTGDIIV